MSNAAKVHEFLNKAQTFYFLTTDGDQPKGRPFGFQMLVDDKVFFGCGTFKNVFKQLTANPKVEVLAVNGGEFLRYDGAAKVVKDDALLLKVREIMPQIMALYDKNGWEMGLFYLENGHAEIRGMMDVERVFLEHGDAFVLSADRLVQIADAIHAKLPRVKTIAMYASIQNIRHKTDADLQRLHERGIGGLDIGVESGLDAALQYMNKGHTAWWTWYAVTDPTPASPIAWSAVPSSSSSPPASE